MWALFCCYGVVEFLYMLLEGTVLMCVAIGAGVAGCALYLVSGGFTLCKGMYGMGKVGYRKVKNKFSKNR